MAPPTPTPLWYIGITSMSSSQPLANIAGSPVISAPNTLATQVPAATGAQPWSRVLTCVCAFMAMSCLALAAAAKGHGSSFYVEDNKEEDLNLLFTFSYILTPGLDRNVLLHLSGLLELIWVCWQCHCLEILIRHVVMKRMDNKIYFVCSKYSVLLETIWWGSCCNTLWTFTQLHEPETGNLACAT